MMILKDIVALANGELFAPPGVRLDPDMRINGIAPLDKAGADEVSFLTNPKYAAKARDTKAGVLLLAQAIPDLSLPQIISKNAYAAMAKISQRFHAVTHTYKGQSELAQVHATAKVHPSATLYPFCFIDARAEIGADCVIYPQVYVGEGAILGDRTVVHPGAVFMHGVKIAADVIIQAGCVIGSDGFGFAPSRDGNEKIPQVGSVEIGPDCEIGALSTINRGAFLNTTLGRGCKFDSQVHIAHGVQLGDFALLAGGAAIAGSTKIGKRFMMAGHTAMGPSLEIGDGVILGPKAGMTRSTDEPGEYMGMPAIPALEWRKQVVALGQLPELLKNVRAAIKRLEKLEQKEESR